MRLGCAVLAGIVAMTAAAATAAAQSPTGQPVPQAAVGISPVRFSDLPGWRSDDHAAAFRTFLRSCDRILASNNGATSSALADACRHAVRRAHRHVGRTEARVFFERFFTPHIVVEPAGTGLLTGYYEPVLDGSLTRTDRFKIPLYRRPPELENVVAETARATAPGFSHMRRTASGLEPYFTRAEIEAGALASRNLELAWLADPVDAFFLQIQGSGQLRLPDGRLLRIAYDGKNGHPYSSVGRYLIDQGVIGADAMSLDRLGAYLREDAARGRQVMQRNASFVFFRALPPDEAKGAIGAQGTTLIPGRSLAVDAAVHAMGTPIYVVSDTLTHARPRHPFRRLMIAQDVGSAIKGAERGDIFFGTGKRAGALAGITKEKGRFYVLLPLLPRGEDAAKPRPA